MCGILILKANHVSKDLKNKFKSALDGLALRGPDDLRMLENKNLLVGFTRLSINDISNGSQPFKSLCGKYLIVFNGEIVNYKELALKLRQKNIKMKHGHEAEVILNLFILYGNKCVEFLRGFFAFVIIKTKTNDIFAAVDRFSIKPLYYYENKKNKLFILTSDYSTLLKSKLLEKNINFSKLTEYFTFAREFDDDTIIKGVKKLSSSSILLSNNNQKKILNYWKPFKKLPNVYESSKSLLKKFDSKFLETIELWKTADTKISLCLSSGMDSNLIKLYLDKNRINYRGFYLIEKNNSQFKSKSVHNIQLNYEKMLSSMNKFSKNSLTPFAVSHSSSTSLFQLYSYIRKEKFKFTLNGEGADELFGGYPRYLVQIKLIKNKNYNLEKSFIELYKKEIISFSSNLKNQKYNVEKMLLKKIKSIKLISKTIENKLLEFDQLTWIPPLIQRHDIIGMHNSLEVRPPFLDHKLVELTNSLPLSLKFSQLNNKVMMVNIFKKYRKKSFHKPFNKIHTPTLFDLILKDEKEMNIFKESLFYGDLGKIFNADKVIRSIDEKKFSNTFLWRLYIFNKMLLNF